MGLRVLEGPALLQHVALHDALEHPGRQWPAGPVASTSQADQRRFARLMVLDDFSDPASMIVKGIAMGGQHGLNLEPANPLQRKDVVVKGIGSRLWVQSNGRADLRQAGVACKEHA